MRGRKKTPQPKLFYERINLDQRIRKDHILRKIDQVISFEFIYMERSFARSCRYGFKRSRWRRLWRVRIQELLTASIQNILSYIRNFKERSMPQETACRFGEVQTASACNFKYDDAQMLHSIIFYLNRMNFYDRTYFKSFSRLTGKKRKLSERA